jgi:hypothetical protein
LPHDPHARPVVKTVFSDVHVIRVGPQSLVQKQSQGVSSSITVVMTECDAEYMDWLLLNATVKYTLEAHVDYNQSGGAGASSCTSTSAIGPAQVDARWHFTSA